MDLDALSVAAPERLQWGQGGAAFAGWLVVRARRLAAGDKTGVDIGHVATRHGPECRTEHGTSRYYFLGRTDAKVKAVLERLGYEELELDCFLELPGGSVVLERVMGKFALPCESIYGLARAVTIEEACQAEAVEFKAAFPEAQWCFCLPGVLGCATGPVPLNEDDVEYFVAEGA